MLGELCEGIKEVRRMERIVSEVEMEMKAREVATACSHAPLNLGAATVHASIFKQTTIIKFHFNKTGKFRFRSMCFSYLEPEPFDWTPVLLNTMFHLCQFLLGASVFAQIMLMGR